MAPWRKTLLQARLGNFILFGLSERNIELLKEGKPISIDGDEIGFPGKRFVIMYGKDNEAIKAELIEVGFLSKEML